MPIRLTWTPPVLQGSGIIGYKIYKTLSPGPLVRSLGHLLQVVDGDVTLYDDYDYDRRLLESFGYLYKVTALTGDTEGNFAAANTVHVQYSFEDFVSEEDWDLTLPGEDILEFYESWDINVYTYSSSGSMTTAGTASRTLTYAFLGTSGMTTDNSATVIFTKDFAGSGDVVLDGVAETSYIEFTPPSGFELVDNQGVTYLSFSTFVFEMVDNQGGTYLEFS